MRELSASRLRLAIESIVAEAASVAAPARALEAEAKQRVSQREGGDVDLLAVAADFATRFSQLPPFPYTAAQTRVLGSWTETVTAYLATAKGPSVRPTLQADGFALLEDGSKAVAAAVDDAAAARSRAGIAVEALSRQLAQDAVAQRDRAAAELLAALSAATALTGKLSQATSSLTALRTEMTAVQVSRAGADASSRPPCRARPGAHVPAARTSRPGHCARREQG